MSISIDNSGDCENKPSMKADSDVDGEEKCCFRDAKLSWLENWNETKSSAVKYRISSKKNRKKLNKLEFQSNISGIKKKQSTTILTTSLSEFVESEAVAKDTYYVQLHAPYGLGLSLFVSYEGIVTVEGLHYLANKQASPAQMCGLIKVEDQLIRLNNINIEALDFYATTNLLKDLDKYAKEDVITLGFRYGDRPPHLVSNDYDHNKSSSSEDSEEEEEGGELTLVTCQEQLQDTNINTDTVIDRRRSGGGGKISSSRGSSHNLYLNQSAQGSRESLSNHQIIEKPVEHKLPFSNKHEQRKSRESYSSQYEGSDTNSQSGSRKAVINPEDVFLSLFTDTADPDGALLGGLLPSLSSWRLEPPFTSTIPTGTGKVQQLPQTSELALYQQNMRNRHMYRVALRSSCFDSAKLPEQQLRELAEEIFEWRPFQLNYNYAGYFSRPILPVTYKSDHSNLSSIQTKSVEDSIKKLNEMKVSSLITTPIDTAQYNHTQHLLWDDSTQSYLPKTAITNKKTKVTSYLDHQIAMKEVLLSLELAAHRVCNNNNHSALLKSQLQRQYNRSSPPKSSQWECASNSLEGFIVPNIGASRSRNNTAEADLTNTSNNTVVYNSNMKVNEKEAHNHNIISTKHRLYNRQSTVPETNAITLSAGVYIHNPSTSNKILDRLNDNSAVHMIPYALPCFDKKEEVRYFRKSYEHIISVEHTAVQRILRNQRYTQSLVLLQEAVDMEIYSLSNSYNDTVNHNSSTSSSSSTSNPYHCARHYHTNIEIFLPDMVLTYQIFYALQHYRAGILNSGLVLDCIEKWATTFDPIGIITVLNTTTTITTNTPTPTTMNTTTTTTTTTTTMNRSTNSYNDIHHYLNNSNNTTLFETNYNKTQEKTGQKHSNKPEFLVFFNNDRQTVRNIHVFIQVVSELLTFLVVSRINAECLIIEQQSERSSYKQKNNNSSRSNSSTSGNTSNTNTDNASTSSAFEKGFKLHHLGVQIEYSYSNIATQSDDHADEHIDATSSTTTASTTSTNSSSSKMLLPGLLKSLPDNLIVGYIRKFQYLLQFDIIMMAACIKQYTLTIRNIILILQNNSYFTILSTQMKDFIYKSQDSILGFSQLYQRIQYCYENISINTTTTPTTTIISSYKGNKKEFSLLLCLLLSELRFFFITHTALALDIAATMFPMIPPWYVSMILFGSSNSSGSSQFPEDSIPLIHAESTYYAYLTRLIRNRSELCSHDSSLVLEWLGLALRLDHETLMDDHMSGGNFGLLSSPIQKRKSSYLVTVRTVLYHPERYNFDIYSAVRLCGMYECTEGVLLLSKHWMELIEKTNIQTSVKLVEQCLEITQLLQETTGRLISELVLFIHTGDDASPVGKQQKTASVSRLAIDIDIEDSSSASSTKRLSQLCRILSACVCVLLKAYELQPMLDPAHSVYHAGSRDTLPLARLGGTFDTLVDAAIQALCPECEQPVDTPTTTTTSNSPTTTTTIMQPWIQQIADISGDVLLQSLGVPRTLTLLQYAPILRTQLST